MRNSVSKAMLLAMVLSLTAGAVAEADDDRLGWAPLSVGDANRMASPTDAATDGQTIVVVGASGSGAKRQAYLWASPDAGSTWIEVTDLRGRPTSTPRVVNGPAGFVALGLASVAMSTDGLAWEAVDGPSGSDPAGTVFTPTSVAAMPDSFVAAGILHGRDGLALGPAISRSSDGATWGEPGLLAEDDGVRAVEVVAAGKDTLLAAYSSPVGDAPGVVVVRSTDDGTTWERTADIPTGSEAPASIRLSQAAGRTYLGVVGANGPDSLLASSDSSSWSEVADLSGQVITVGPSGAGAVAIGSGHSFYSADGDAWMGRPVASLRGAHLLVPLELSDGSVVAIGQTGSGKKRATGAWLGRLATMENSADRFEAIAAAHNKREAKLGKRGYRTLAQAKKLAKAYQASTGVLLQDLRDWPWPEEVADEAEQEIAQRDKLFKSYGQMSRARTVSRFDKAAAAFERTDLPSARAAAAMREALGLPLPDALREALKGGR